MKRRRYATCINLELRLSTLATNVVEATRKMQRAIEGLIPGSVADVTITPVDASVGWVTRDRSGKTPIIDYVQFSLDNLVRPRAPVKDLDVDLIPTYAPNEHGMSAALHRWELVHELCHWQMRSRTQ